MLNLEKEIREQPKVLAEVITKNEGVLSAIVNDPYVAKVNSVYFAARGTSDHACIYAQYLFGILAGIPCTLGTPSVFTKYGSDIDFGGQLVIGVSQSGRAADCLAVLESANRQGAVTVAVTNNTDSPMAKCAKYHLYCSAGPEISIAATKTFTSQAALLGALASMMAEKVKNRKNDYLSLLGKVSGCAETFLKQLPAEIEKQAIAYKDIPGAIVLGRGVSYPIALEGALKMLETNKLSMKGYAASDFHHGPVAQIKPGDKVILLAPSGCCFDDAKEMAKKVTDIGAELLILSDENADFIPCGKTVILPYTGSELTAPFLQVLFFQLLACKMTEVRGLDPDKAGVINKITITK